jgi:hypothetical protein
MTEKRTLPPFWGQTRLGMESYLTQKKEAEFFFPFPEV